MKYVMLKRTNPKGGSQLLPVIFPNELAHADVAEALCERMETKKFDLEVVSAGDFCMLTKQATGKSTTLKLKADRERDSQIIANHDYAHGLMEE